MSRSRQISAAACLFVLATSVLSMEKSYDFVVIGGGSAGYAAARTAADLGLTVLIAEGGEVGGLCILRGCMPSKTMIESGNRMLAISRAAEFGINVGAASLDGRKLLERQRRLVAEFADYRRQQLETGAFEFVRGNAEFVDPHTIRIRRMDGSEDKVRAATSLIATGSVSTTIEFPGLAEVGYKDSDAVLESDSVPESVIVLGAGATGLEFAHYYASAGSKVTVLQRGAQVLKGMDIDVAESITGALENRGIAVLRRTTLKRAERTPEGMKRIYFDHEGEERSVSANEIVYALGRKPHLAGLGLEAAGVALAQSRLVMKPTQQTSVPHIFAAGDAAGPHEIVHIAIQQAELAARNAARICRQATPLEEIDYRLKLFAIFTEPQVAVVGESENELAVAGIEHLIARARFDDHGKSMITGETEGFVKLIVAAESREILGAAAVGPKAAELIHEIVVAMHFRATARDLAAVPHYHPTLSEIWTYPAEELA
jgi:pyruvate/2-oxoglutarate dehydrogenase complex dihydrolipoamide dehydrogenase (E3) component